MKHLSPHHLQGGAPDPTPLRRTFLQVVFLWTSILILSSVLAEASTGEVRGFRFSSCSQDGKVCYELTAPLAQHSWDTHQYVFREATLNIFDKGPLGTQLRKSVHGYFGYVHSPSGTVVLRDQFNPDKEALYDLRKDKVLEF